MATVTFACGTPFGGALDSTASLAEAARRAGHRVQLVVARSDPYATRPHTTGAIVRMARLNTTLGRLAWRAHDRVFAGTEPEEYGGFTMLRASDVPAAVDRVHGDGGILVVNSVRRLDLERLIRICRQHDSRIVWYLRELQSLVFLDPLGHDVDVLLANSRPLALEATRITNLPCAYIPSVIPRSGLTGPTDRRVVLLVNPIESHGLELALRLADRAPECRFVLQESWLLGDDGLDHLKNLARSRPNVEIRPKGPRSSVFADARVMIAPHSAAGAGLSRPRVALESQLLGVPMVATDVPGLASVAASPELLIPEHASPDRWLEVLQRVDAEYDRYCDEARQFAEGELPESEELWSQFVGACGIDEAANEIRSSH